MTADAEGHVWLTPHPSACRYASRVCTTSIDVQNRFWFCLNVWFVAAGSSTGRRRNGLRRAQYTSVEPTAQYASLEPTVISCLVALHAAIILRQSIVPMTTIDHHIPRLVTIASRRQIPYFASINWLRTIQFSSTAMGSCQPPRNTKDTRFGSCPNLDGSLPPVIFHRAPTGYQIC